MNTTDDDLSDVLANEVYIHCQMVHKGVRPVASMNLPVKESVLAAEIVEHWGLKYHIQLKPFPCIYIFKYEGLRRLLDEVNKADISGYARDWIFGKLYGYSDDSIHDFLSKKDYSDTLDIQEAYLDLIQDK